MMFMIFQVAPPPPPPPTDDLFGCSKCRYAKNGCTVCRERPTFSRPKQRWKPQQGRPQDVSSHNKNGDR